MSNFMTKVKKAGVWFWITVGAALVAFIGNLVNEFIHNPVLNWINIGFILVAFVAAVISKFTEK